MAKFPGKKKTAYALTAGFLATVLIVSQVLQSEGRSKRYPSSTNDPYWFKLQNDLIFSEEFSLPDYTAEGYGRLEYPALGIDSKKNVYVAYDFTSEDGKEAIFLNAFGAGDLQFQATEEATSQRRYLRLKSELKWLGAVQVSSTAGVEYRPRLAVTPNDDVWVVWSARRDGNWDVFARTYSDGKLGSEMQITSAPSYDFRPVVLADQVGRIWVAWERGTAEKNIQIVVKYFQNGHWSEEIIVEGRPGYAYRPYLIEAENGEVWIAWDFTQDHNTDVYVGRLKDGKLGSPIRVSTHPAIDSKATLAWHDKKLWIAWTTNRRGENGWGVIRYPLVRVFDGSKWYKPLTQMNGIDLESRSETQSYEYPTMTFDPYGRLYLFTRHDHVFSGAFYDDGKWSENWLLDVSSWGLRGFYVHTAWLSDRELWMARRDRRTIYFQKMVRTDPEKKKAVLREYMPKSYPTELNYPVVESRRGPTNHGDYRVYYGDLHVHTAYSDGSGSFDELYNLYKNIYKVDFLAITDHDALRLASNRFSPGEWAYLKALNEIYNQPGEFVTINGYEWTHSTWSGRQDSTVRIGHKNVYFKGGEDAPFFNHHDDVAYDAVSLFQTLAKNAAIAFPHHPAWGGMTWGDHDPEIQTNYEIVSIHGANEYMGNLPIPHRGGMPGTFVQDGLAKGKVFGLVGASDSHGLYYHANEGWRADPYKGGLTAVLLDGPLSRENVWQALKSRRNYATSGEKYYLEFAVNGHPMGSTLTVKEPPIITFEVRASGLLYAYIIRNNKERFISGPIGGSFTAYRGMTDETIETGDNFYYLRAVFKDGTVAWSSPIWVTFTPQ